MGTPIITLTTDYGTRDHYVATLKGVILSIAPNAQIVDVTHEIEAHDVRAAAFVLSQVWSWFPTGTIHVAVVDPGVGTSRRVIVGRYAGSFVVAPDNGLVTFVHRELPVEAMHVAEDRRFFLPQLSTTFHGRDVLAPIAAHLALGAGPRDFGRPVERIELLDVPYRAPRSGEGFVGGVLHIDRFGTLITNVHASQLADAGGSDRAWRVKTDEVDLGILRSVYADVAAGEALALIGGSGFVEIAVNQGRAVDRFGGSPRIEVSRPTG